MTENDHVSVVSTDLSSFLDKFNKAVSKSVKGRSTTGVLSSDRWEEASQDGVQQGEN